MEAPVKSSLLDCALKGIDHFTMGQNFADFDCSPFVLIHFHSIIFRSYLDITFVNFHDCY